MAVEMTIENLKPCQLCCSWGLMVCKLLQGIITRMVCNLTLYTQALHGAAPQPEIWKRAAAGPAALHNRCSMAYDVC